MRTTERTLAVFALILAGAVPALAQRLRTERFQNREVVSQEIIVRFRGGANSTPSSQSLRSQDTDISSTSAVGRSGAVRLRSRGRSVAELIQAYSRRADVEYAEPNYVWHAADIPNDTFFGEQWALQNTGQVVVQSGTAGADIKAVQAWDVAEGSRGIVVGMIDSGIDYTHPDLLSNIWSATSAFTVIVGGQAIQCAAGTHGFNAITRTCDPMDDDGHGTHTAGIVGASGNNGVAMSGVSRVSNIMAIKFLDSSGQGTTENAIAAIEFAIEVKKKFPLTANVRVLNASWGGLAFSQALLDEINIAGLNEILFVASAGNSSGNIDTTPEYPAAYNAANLISVAATDNRDQLADFSNYGAGKVHLGAPGVEILSTLRGKFYGRQSGTSASAPMVSGAAALVLSACGLTTAQLKSDILSTVDVIPSLSDITATGGRLNVNSAIRSCAGPQPATFTLVVTPFAQTIAFGFGAQFSLSVNPLNGFGSSVTFSATNLPVGMSANFAPNTIVNGSSTLSIDLAPDVVQGTYLIGISATGGDVTRTIGILVTAGIPAGCTIDPAFGSAAGKLDPTDAASVHRPPAFADYCNFTLTSDRAVGVEMRSGVINSFIYLLSDTGTVLASDDDGLHSGQDSQILAELGAGTYTIEATTLNPGQTGGYTLFLRSLRPTVTSVSPNFGTQGTSVDISITGTVFFGSPITVKVNNCPGATVGNIHVVNTTNLTATLTLPNNHGTCTIAVSNPGGESNTAFFTVHPLTPVITGLSISSGLQGQIVPITITGTNFVPGSQVSFNGLTRPSNVVSSTTITTTLFLSITASPGVFGITVTTSGGTSNAAPFTVLLAPPVLFPFNLTKAGGPGLSVDVVLSGTSFFSPLQIDAGPYITVTNVNIRESQTIDARFNIAANAPYGDYEVRIITAAGTTGPQIFKVVPPPAITSLNPDRAYLGANTTITVTGTNLYCGREPSIDGIGVFVGSVGGGPDPCGNVTTATILVQALTTAPVGPRTLTITTPNGTSNPVTLNILRPPPVIGNITPLYGAQGTSVAITINGANLSSGSVSVSGNGVQSSNESSTAVKLTATLTIAPNASVGARNITVTTIDGTSEPAVFSVTPPAWPDLSIRQTLPPKTASGFNEIFLLSLRNDGEAANVNPVTVTSRWSLGGGTVSSASPGWACSFAAPVVTCTSSNAIAPHTEVPVAITMSMPPDTGGFFTNTVTVISSEDFNTSNNTATQVEEIVSSPVPSLVTLPAMQPGQQGTMSLSFSTPFFKDITGTLNSVVLSFTPTTPGAPMDPAVQFATGGLQVSYIIRANTLQAEFQGITGPLGFQTGTVAGGLKFTATYKAGNNPTRTIISTTTVVEVAPSVKSIKPEKNSSGFTTSITLLSSTREMRNLVFQFNTASPIQLSCGGIPSCIANATTLTFNVATIFSTWYADNSAYGSLATLTVPFNIQGAISGSITVTLTNKVGNSNSMSFTIP